ncbi:MAG: hypothetical protein GYA36_07680 [Veillonellaceae bacterium]|nr:hypothetical protein [Veillonellaceae bacterium]
MNKTAKLVLIGLFVLIAAGLAYWQFSGASLTGVARQLILQTAGKSINGTLTLGEIDFSLAGELTAQQVAVHDKGGALVAAARKLTLKLDLSDILSRSLDIGRVRSVRLDGLTLQLSRDRQERWNVSETLRRPAAEPAAPAAVFRGRVEVADAAVAIATPDSRYEFKQVNGQLDFANYPNIAIDLKSKQAAADLAAKGVWNFSGGGKIEASVAGADPAVFTASSPLKGAVTTRFRLEGTTAKPTAQGSFSIPAGSLGDTAFRDAAGEFSWADGTLTLAGTTLNALGGNIATSGPIALDTRRFSQTVSGRNLDSSQLSDKDIQGRLNFSAQASGQGDGDHTNADGTFSMGAGSISGIAFDALTGNFAKRGQSMRYYNLRATIAGQVIAIDDADSLNSIKTLFRLPLVPVQPELPKVPAVPGLPKLPTLPRLF